MKHEYNIGDVVKVKHVDIQNRIAIIIDKSEMKIHDKHHNTYQMMICGITKGTFWFLESLILEKL